MVREMNGGRNEQVAKHYMVKTVSFLAHAADAHLVLRLEESLQTFNNGKQAVKTPSCSLQLNAMSQEKWQPKTNV